MNFLSLPIIASAGLGRSGGRPQTSVHCPGPWPLASYTGFVRCAEAAPPCWALPLESESPPYRLSCSRHQEKLGRLSGRNPPPLDLQKNLPPTLHKGTPALACHILCGHTFGKNFREEALPSPSRRHGVREKTLSLRIAQMHLHFLSGPSSVCPGPAEKR